jgi:lipopolysaccharide transport system ATP-binding protein
MSSSTAPELSIQVPASGAAGARIRTVREHNPAAGTLAIAADKLGKEYKIRRTEKAVTLAESAVARLKSPRQKKQVDILHALRDVSFTINHGEAVGIIGHNGAGKSTLLKVLTRITSPSAGSVRIRGRIGSLLEVGTGFHPELTARENIHLAAAILGMRPNEITKSFDQIVDFSGISAFLETPVKRFSSGMYVRLAFAVAAHLPSEILLIDEALAVGDAAFKERGTRRMQELAHEGRTLLYVSHQMSSIKEVCDRSIVMQRGTIIFDGDVSHGIDEYNRSVKSVSGVFDEETVREGSGEVRVTKFAPVKPIFSTFEPKEFRFAAEVGKDIGEYSLSMQIFDESGEQLVRCESRLVAPVFNGTTDPTGTFRLLTPWLKPGTYRIRASAVRADGELLDWIPNAGTFDVSETYAYAEPDVAAVNTGRVLPQHEWIRD